MIWFTADWHLGHQFMLRGIPGEPVPRPKFSSVEEMNETIIENHNRVVKPGDLVYNLGDFALKISTEEALTYFKRLNGMQFLIEGNHEVVGKKLPWIWVRDIEQIHPQIEMEGLEPIVLCHYAMRTWEGSHRGTWQLYGHSHSMLPELPELLSFDIGVDVPEWNYTPVSLEQVAEKMKAKRPAWEAWVASLGRPVGF